MSRNFWTFYFPPQQSNVTCVTTLVRPNEICEESLIFVRPRGLVERVFERRIRANADSKLTLSNRCFVIFITSYACFGRSNSASSRRVFAARRSRTRGPVFVTPTSRTPGPEERCFDVRLPYIHFGEPSDACPTHLAEPSEQLWHTSCEAARSP